LTFLAAAAFAAMLAGCSSCKPGKGPGKPQPYNVQIKLGDALKDKSIQVDLVGANPSDIEQLKAYNINKYWDTGDPFRADRPKFTASFVGGQQSVQTLSMTDPVWQQWIGFGAQYIVIIANLPDIHQDSPGSQDPRRQILPICECYWPSKTKEINVEVQASGVRVVTPPRPEQSLPPGW
jgi:hypothetical protein